MSPPYTDPSDPETRIDLTLTTRDLASVIFEFQIGQIAVRSLPAILAAIVAEGRTSATAVLGEVKGAAVLASRGATRGGSAILMHMAVVCSDDPVTSPDDMIVEPDASAYARAYGASVLDEYIEFCRAVDVPPPPDATDVDVTTDVPVPVLAGDLDARTPAIRSELVAETLPRASLVLFPEGTHVQLGEVNLGRADPARLPRRPGRRAGHRLHRHHAAARLHAAGREQQHRLGTASAQERPRIGGLALAGSRSPASASAPRG